MWTGKIKAPKPSCPSPSLGSFAPGKEGLRTRKDKPGGPNSGAHPGTPFVVSHFSFLSLSLPSFSLSAPSLSPSSLTSLGSLAPGQYPRGPWCVPSHLEPGPQLALGAWLPSPELPRAPAEGCLGLGTGVARVMGGAHFAVGPRRGRSGGSGPLPGERRLGAQHLLSSDTARIRLMAPKDPPGSCRQSSGLGSSCSRLAHSFCICYFLYFAVGSTGAREPSSYIWWALGAGLGLKRGADGWGCPQSLRSTPQE